MAKIYILFADGYEVIEALATADVMFRAGIETVRVAVGSTLDVTSSHNLATVHCDCTIDDARFDDGDALILPGGNPGYINLRSSTKVCDVVRDFYNSGRIVGAICGAPTVLAAAGIAHHREITCHSSVVGEMGEYSYRGGSVVEDGNLITGAGAGVSVEFALAVAARLTDSNTLSQVRRAMELSETLQ